MKDKLTQPIQDIMTWTTGLLNGDYGELANVEQRHDLEAIRDSLKQHQIESDEISSVIEQDDVYMLVELSDQRLGPLNAITGFCWFLLEDMSGPLSPQQSEVVSKIRDKADYLLGQFQNIWEYARIKSGAAIWMKSVYFDFQTRVIQTSDLPEHVQLVIPEHLPWVYADEIYVKRSLVNLVNNAVQFCPQGRIVISAHVKDDQVVISVQDEGIGIEEGQIEKIFEPFWQVDELHPGLGLGLYIARSHLERMRGTLQVESAPGEGATFTFTLPTQPA